MGRTHRIHDIVHGYIEIPQQFLDLVDTAAFQRLRRIRQGLNHGVYPSANHTRFEHSLGVYHLGRRVFGTLKIRNPNLVGENSLLAACLLHDIGHLPFSHLGELLVEKEDVTRRKQELADKIASKMEDLETSEPATHEVMSALFVFEPEVLPLVEACGADPPLVAKMIIGYAGSELSREERALACVVKSSLDVDRLDYLVRDSHMTSPWLASIDLDRLIDGYLIEEGGGLVFDYHSESVLQNLLYNRTALYAYVINHHSSVLAQVLWLEYLEKAANAKPSLRSDLFSYEAVRRGVDDYDALAAMKSIRGTIDQQLGEAVFDRKKCYRPLWKTEVEYMVLHKQNTANHPNGKLKISSSFVTKSRDLGGRCRGLESRVERQCGLVSGDCFVVMCKNRVYGADGRIRMRTRSGQVVAFEDIFKPSYSSLPEEFPYAYLKTSVWQDEARRKAVVDALFSP